MFIATIDSGLKVSRLEFLTMAKRALNFSELPGSSAGSSTPKQPKNAQPQEELSPRTIKTPKQRATVNAMVVSISPTKPGARYFDGELTTDGNAITRIVGFEKKQRDELESYCTRRVPVTLKNCEIQRSIHQDKLEVKLKSNTQIEISDAKFNIPDLNFKTIGSKQLSLAQLRDTNEFDRVTVAVQVVKVDEPQKVGEGRNKQEVKIADSTSSASLTLWESDINSLKVGQCYQLNRFAVRIFRGRHHLSYPPTGASVDLIDDIGEVVEDALLDDPATNHNLVKAVTVIGVNQLQPIYSCLFCKKGNIEDTSSNVGTCPNCQTVQLLKKQKLTAKLFLENPAGSHLTVRAYDDALKQIAQCENVTTADLLNAPPFEVKYDDYHVVTDVSRSI